MKLGEGHVENTAAAETIGSWNVQATIDLCGWLAELGVTETIIPLPPLDSYDAYLERLRWVAEEIMPKVALTLSARGSSEERCGGQDCFCTYRYWWPPYH